jgi:hypothetical protein
MTGLAASQRLPADRARAQRAFVSLAAFATSHR